MHIFTKIIVKILDSGCLLTIRILRICFKYGIDGSFPFLFFAFAHQICLQVNKPFFTASFFPFSF